MSPLRETCWAEIIANKPLAGVEQEFVGVLDAEFLHAVSFEREEATSSPHKTRKRRGFKGRSNPDGTKPSTVDATGQTKAQVAREARDQGVRFWIESTRSLHYRTYTPDPFRLSKIPKYAEDGSIKGYREI